jgi:hypothetical protein
VWRTSFFAGAAMPLFVQLIAMGDPWESSQSGLH